MTAEIEYIDLKELSRKTSLSTRTLREWVKEPVQPLPCYKVKGKLLFSWKEVVKWIEQFRIETVDIDEITDNILRVNDEYY